MLRNDKYNTDVNCTAQTQNDEHEGVWIISIKLFRFYFSVSSLVLVSIENIYQTPKTVFDHIFKHPDVREKYSATRRISTLFSEFGNVVKHGLSCLIYYVNTDTKFYFLQTKVVHTTVSGYRTERNSQMRHAQ